MRILYCSITYLPDVNGQAIFTQSIIQGMADSGHIVMLLTPAITKEQETVENPKIKIVRVRSIHLARVHQDLYLPIFSRSFIRNLFDQFHPDIVHIQDPSPLCQAVISEARLRHIPVIITHHLGSEITSPYIHLKCLILKRVLQWIVWKLLLLHLRRGDLIVVPSRFSAQMLISHGVSADIQIIACGVYLDDFQPRPELNRNVKRQQFCLDINKTLFLYLGRVDSEKNLETIIRAMARLKRTDIQLAIVGQGKEKIHLQRLASKIGLGSLVVFVGSVAHDDVPDLLNSSDVFIMPGSAESFSIATLEAMACAKPILAANSAALPELVTHQVNGYLFQPDQPVDAATWIERLADQKEVRERLGAYSLAKAYRYSMPNMVRSYERAYQLCRRVDDNYKGKAPLTETTNISASLLSRARRVMTTRIMITLLVIFALLFSTFSYDQAQAIPNLQITNITQLYLSPAQKLLVIAPHPDDEVLAAGGLMQNVLENGGKVLVVVVTNGDGQYLAPMLVRPWSVPRDVDYVTLGVHRQDETLAALEQIGVNGNAVIFLGYPDGKLRELWSRDWYNVTPTISPYTHASTSLYKNTYNPQASYRGSDLFNDLVEILENFQPDIVVVPHPEDTHSDHASVSDFSQFAIASYLASSSNTHPRILAYLVHYEVYPVPRGENFGKYILPPAALANDGKGWVTYSLSYEERVHKKIALDKYVSQLRSSGSFLRSFVRANEIFYELSTMDMPVVSYTSDELLEDGLQAKVVYPEPVRERASRLVLSGADLVSWRAARMGDLICFGAEIRGSASKLYNYRVLAKLPDGANLMSQPDDVVWFTDQNFGACFSLDNLGNPPAIGFSAETRSRAMLVDRTAWHFLYFSDN